MQTFVYVKCYKAAAILILKFYGCFNAIYICPPAGEILCVIQNPYRCLCVDGKCVPNPFLVSATNLTIAIYELKRRLWIIFCRTFGPYQIRFSKEGRI